MPEAAKKLLLGEFGQTVKQPNPEVLKKAIGNAPRITCRPADRIAPQLAQFEKACAKWKQKDEDVLTYALFSDVAEKFFEYRDAQQTGSGFAKVIKTTCYLADIKDFAAFNEVYSKFFISKPARSCFAVKDLPKGALCEIECVAEA